ncbi:MAG: hypothetical protein ACK56F_28915, partial [bacterium]
DSYTSAELYLSLAIVFFGYISFPTEINKVIFGCLEAATMQFGDLVVSILLFATVALLIACYLLVYYADTVKCLLLGRSVRDGAQVAQSQEVLLYDAHRPVESTLTPL